MKSARTFLQLAFAALAAGTALFFGAAVNADPLSFTDTPVGNAVAQMSRQYGLNIVFRANVNAGLPVTFSVEKPDTAVGRIEAVSNVANALGLDYQKVFVISKIDTGAVVPEVKIDIDGPVVFPQTKMSAREAIQTVAAVDDALTQISGAVTGDVVFPSRRMTASAAAAVIAKQTQTGWKAYYGLYRQGEQPPSLAGTVEGRTKTGEEVTLALPLTFRKANSTPAPVAPTPAVSASATPPVAAALPNAPTVATVPSASALVPFGYNPYAYGSPYGYPYGYTPYNNYFNGSLGNGYLGADGNFIPPGYIYSTDGGVMQASPGYNAPQGFVTPGASVVTIPNTAAVLLPYY